MSIYDFRQDLRNGMKLEDALKKHNMSFQEAFEGCKRMSPSNDSNFHNIYCDRRNGKFMIQKWVGTILMNYGSYDDLDVAVLVRDFVEKQDWSKEGLKEFLDGLD